MTPSAHSIVPCSGISTLLRCQAAHLACQAVPALYHDIEDMILPVLATEFLVPGSELAAGIAVLDDEIRGLFAAYPAEEYSARQRVSLHHALTELSPGNGKLLIRQLSALASEIPTLGLEGEYLARFAVREDQRGSGLADAMMKLLRARASKVSLHVQANNLRAIGFYRRHGFEQKAATSGFLLMGTV